MLFIEKAHCKTVLFEYICNLLQRRFSKIKLVVSVESEMLRMQGWIWRTGIELQTRYFPVIKPCPNGKCFIVKHAKTCFRVKHVDVLVN